MCGYALYPCWTSDSLSIHIGHTTHDVGSTRVMDAPDLIRHVENDVYLCVRICTVPRRLHEGMNVLPYIYNGAYS